MGVGCRYLAHNIALEVGQEEVKPPPQRPVVEMLLASTDCQYTYMARNLRTCLPIYVY